MSEMAKTARAAMKAKAKRLGSSGSTEKVDSSTFTPPELLNAQAKTGMRPVSRRTYKSGGKVQGECAPIRADRKQRKAGGKAEKADDTHEQFTFRQRRPVRGPPLRGLDRQCIRVEPRIKP